MGTDGADLAPYASRLEANLRETVSDFWYPRCIDDEHGGYLLGFDAAGEPDGDERREPRVERHRRPGVRA